MPLRKSKGEMYNWVDCQHTHIGGQCVHGCRYCYVEASRFGRAPRYTGEIRMIDDEFKVKYDEKTLTRVCGKYPATIFMENSNDMFANSVPNSFILRVLMQCCYFNENTYVFQTKNPDRYLSMDEFFPTNTVFGCTIETNRNIAGIWSHRCPSPRERYEAFKKLKKHKFITIEPIMEFDPEFIDWIIDIRPDFVNIGADSKNCGLPEPDSNSVRHLVDKLVDSGILVKQKRNLERIYV